MTTTNEQIVDAMAENWYGYGRWEAPYWFLGPQPGGGDFLAPAQAWNQLGRGELLDCKKHHFEFGFTKWHTPNYPLQPTWRRLMRLMMSSLNRDHSNGSLKAYQSEPWGSKFGKTCVIELCAVASRKYKKIDNEARVTRRIARLRQKIADHKPKYVVMYGLGQKQEWEAIAGGPFGPDSMRRAGHSLLLFKPHPGAHEYTEEYWIESGRVLRDSLLSI